MENHGLSMKKNTNYVTEYIGWEWIFGFSVYGIYGQLLIVWDDDDLLRAHTARMTPK